MAAEIKTVQLKLSAYWCVDVWPAALLLAGVMPNNVTRTLQSGPLLLAPDKNEVVETPFGSVSVAAGSMALIVSSTKGLAVFNLHDSHKNAVVINGGGGTYAVNPGRSAVRFPRVMRQSHFEETTLLRQ